METYYTVDEMTTRLGITPRTLHYYEEVGLIPEVPRTEGGHRCYDRQSLERLEHILRLKAALGISLQDISAILEAENNLGQLKQLYRGKTSDSEKEKLLDQAVELLQTLVDTIDEKIGKLQLLRAGFNERLENAKRIKQNK